MPILCSTCSTNSAVFKQPKTGQAICKECFFNAFEAEVHQTICTNNLFERGELIAIGASGGKDSTVLAYVLKVLNERHNYGLDLVLLSVDEGITGYRDDSLETVKRNQQKYELPLKIVSYEELYGWDCHSAEDWVEKQLHILWGVSTTSFGQGSLAAQSRQDCDWS